MRATEHCRLGSDLPHTSLDLPRCFLLQIVPAKFMDPHLLSLNLSQSFQILGDALPPHVREVTSLPAVSHQMRERARGAAPDFGLVLHCLGSRQLALVLKWREGKEREQPLSELNLDRSRNKRPALGTRKETTEPMSTHSQLYCPFPKISKNDLPCRLLPLLLQNSFHLSPPVPPTHDTAKSHGRCFQCLLLHSVLRQQSTKVVVLLETHLIPKPPPHQLKETNRSRPTSHNTFPW